MRTISSPPRMLVVRKEEKEARLVASFAHALEAVGQGCLGPRDVLVVARSAESPVIRVLLSRAEDLLAAGFNVRALLARGPAPAEFQATGLAATRFDWRVAADLRLLDAHEQLILAGHVWIGDCMRRDPAKRDAYELYGENCPETLEALRRYFERLWRHGAAVFGLFPHSSDQISTGDVAASLVPVQDVAVSAASGTEGDPVVSTRH